MSTFQSVNLNSVSPSDREQLANLILQYVNQDLLDTHFNWHQQAMDNPEIDLTQFFGFHRQLIGGLEKFLSANGAGAFVPLPFWDPDEPIPPEFYLVKPPGQPLENGGPITEVPQFFIPPAVCDFTTERQLSAAFREFHAFVHNNVGGAMASPATSPTASIFWPWHKFVDLIAANWEQC
jgi:hypothetical protein